jgi:hypothetical protein
VDTPLGRIPPFDGTEIVKYAIMFCVPLTSSIQKVRLDAEIAEITGWATSLSFVLGDPLASPSVMVADGVTPIFGYVTTMVDAEAPMLPFVFVAVIILPVRVIEPDVPPPMSPIVTEPLRTFGK